MAKFCTFHQVNRLRRAGEPIVHNHQVRWELGKAITVNEGSDVTLISTGAMLKTTVDAASALFEKGIKARVLSMHTLKPIDKKAILDAARETGGILTIEEHSLIGGLGGAGRDRGQISEVRYQKGKRQPSTQSYAVPRRSEIRGRSADYADYTD